MFMNMEDTSKTQKYDSYRKFPWLKDLQISLDGKLDSLIKWLTFLKFVLLVLMTYYYSFCYPIYTFSEQ